MVAISYGSYEAQRDNLSEVLGPNLLLLKPTLDQIQANLSYIEEFTIKSMLQQGFSELTIYGKRLEFVFNDFMTMQFYCFCLPS